jgi:hypothetical protein
MFYKPINIPDLGKYVSSENFLQPVNVLIFYQKRIKRKKPAGLYDIS